jgi:hypothetical protein
MARDSRLDLFKHRYGRADLPGRAITALIAVMFDEGCLHGMKLLGLAQSLDRGDPVAFVHDGERETRIDAHSVHEHRAGPALTVVASLLGAGQAEILTQSIEKCGFR